MQENSRSLAVSTIMNNGPIKNTLALPCESELLVPHRRPIRMIDRLIEFNDKSGVVEVLVNSENLLVAEDGILDGVALVEIIAQAYAAIKGYDDLSHNLPVKKGFLVAVKHMECNGKAHIGDLLKVRASTVSEVGGFAVAEGVVMREEAVLASASLTLWVP
jgi:3-hydroxyacyl-[acyl-carrier-protein] dehydratase